jgi:hypothetical protein
MQFQLKSDRVDQVECKSRRRVQVGKLNAKVESKCNFS